MFFDQFNADEVFNEYARIMEDEGHLEKKASYVVPKSFLGDDNYTEVEVHAELQRMAAEGSQDGKLYNVVSEDVVTGAHPEGSTKIVDAAEGLGEVETLEATQTKMKDVAEKKVKLAQAILAFATDLDKSGFIALAKNLDEKVGPFLGVKLANGPSEEGEEEDAEPDPEMAADDVEVTMGEPTITTETPEERKAREHAAFMKKMPQKGPPVKPTYRGPGEVLPAAGEAKQVVNPLDFTQPGALPADWDKKPNPMDFTQPGALPADWDK